MAKNKVISTTASSCDMFQRLLMSELQGLEVVKEYQFHYTRKWRFDYAIPRYKVAIEIDGGVWQYGRHNRPDGYINDMEKLNTAASMGWLVLRFTTAARLDSSTMTLIRNTVNYKRECHEVK